MSQNYLFTSESVARGHPDKVADQISDAILDECIRQDPFSRVACETMVCPGLVILAGEISSKAQIDFTKIVRNTIHDIGYTDASLGFDYRSCGVLTSISKQSLDIALGVDEHLEMAKELGAGDQGIMFGYACNETDELMPLPIMLAHRIVAELDEARLNQCLPYLKPDGKTQVTVEYGPDHIPKRIHTVVLSTQHAAEVEQETIHRDMQNLVRSVGPAHMIDANTVFYINPTGRFVIGGPQGDSGLTGRKIIVDTYGGMSRHGGGAFSGKDPTKVDRSASYAARYIAKNIVAAGLADRCEIQLSYAIGLPHPLALNIETFGTSVFSDQYLEELIHQHFDLTPQGIINMLDLRRPIYTKTAFGGHFGRNSPEFTWERTDKAKALKNDALKFLY